MPALSTRNHQTSTGTPSDTPHNYHLYSLTKLIAIKTGTYQSNGDGGDSNNDVNHVRSGTRGFDSSTPRESGETAGSGGGGAKLRHNYGPEGGGVAGGHSSHQHSRSHSELLAGSSMNVNRDFLPVPSTTEDDVSSVHSIGELYSSRGAPHASIGGELAKDSQTVTPPKATSMHNLHLLNDDVFSSLESFSNTTAEASQNDTPSLQKSHGLSKVTTPAGSRLQLQQKPKATPQLNYDEHPTPNTDSDSDYFQQESGDSPMKMRKRRKRMSIRLGSGDASDDESRSHTTHEGSPHARSKNSGHAKRGTPGHRVGIKTVCNGAVNRGGFHIVAIYCTNDVLILRFEVRDSFVTTAQDDHSHGANGLLDSNYLGDIADDSHLFASASGDHLMGMGRYSDIEDDDNMSIVTGSTSLNSASNTPNTDRHSQRDLEILKYRRLVRQYQSVSQSQWDNHVNRGAPLPELATPAAAPNSSWPALTMPAPIVRTITYFRDRNISIDEMLMDDKFLICVDKSSPHGDVYLLPLCRLIFPHVESNVWPFKVQRKATHLDSGAETQEPAAALSELFNHAADNASSMDASSLLEGTISSAPSMRYQTNTYLNEDIPSLLDYTQLISESSKSSSQENFLASLRFITKLSPKKRTFNSKKFGYISCTCLWKTFLNKHFLVLGTTRGYLLFLNLHTQLDECYTTIPGTRHAAIHEIRLISDPKEQYKYLALTLMTGISPPSKNSSKSHLLSSLSASSSNLHGGSITPGGSPHKFFYKQVLEQKDPTMHTYKTFCEYKQYSQLSDGINMHMNSKYDIMVFTPVPLLESEEFASVNAETNTQTTPSSTNSSYTLSVYEDPQKGPMLCMFNKIDNRLSLYDPQDTRFPLYIFQLNSHSTLFHVTQSLLFTVQKSSALKSTPQPEHIWVISRLFANANAGGSSSYSISTPSWTHGQHQATKSASVFQDFQLPPKQHIRGVLPGYHCQHSGQNDEGETSGLDGCLVWTQNAVYEMRQEHTPTHIFRKLLRHGLAGDGSDRFAKTFKLDILRLYEQEADRAFRHSNYDRAFQLYDYSFITERKKVAKLMQSHRIDDVLKYLNSLLNDPQNLPLDKKKELSDLLFTSYLYKLTQGIPIDNEGEETKSSSDSENDRSRSASNANTKQSDSAVVPSPVANRRRLSLKNKRLDSPFRNSKFLDRGIGSQCEVPVDCMLWKEFRKFLLDSHDYNASVAVNKLVDNGMIAMALEVANHGGIMTQVLNYLLQKKYVSLSTECMDFLFQYAYAADLVAIGEGIFLHASPPNVQVKFFLEYIKKSRQELERIVREQDPTIEEHHLFSKEELSRIPLMIQNLQRRFSSLIHCVNEEMVLLEIAQTFNPEKSLFVSYDSYGFSRSTNLPDEVRRKQHEKRDSLFYYPHFPLQVHAEMFLVSMIQLSALKRALDNSVDETNILGTGQKKISDASPGSFSHAYLYRHTQEKLEQNIQFCSHLYRAQVVLSVCMKYKNIDALCSVYENNDMWSDSLCCRLSQIKQLTSSLSEDQLSQRIFLLFEKYILLQKQHKNSNQIHTKALLILKIFEFWKKNVKRSEKLKDFEKMCTQHIGDIGPSLAYILLHRGDELPPQYDEYRHTHPLILPFSHHFMLQITKEHINSMKKSRHEKQISISNLQTQILRNMEKDLLEKEHKYIVMPNETLRTHGEWFVFTCSHMYSKDDFTNNIMKTFYAKTRELIQNISQQQTNVSKEIEAIILAIHFVEQEYRVHMRCDSGVSRQSCPVCIYNYLCSRVVKKGLLSTDEKSLLWRAPSSATVTLSSSHQYGRR
mmetsp:Transcript_261/g.876  ORF Transcript_261/g.876 Transcript_261/m.876 type:complete len:1795 (-) Transcript_261:26-5410(-)